MNIMYVCIYHLGFVEKLKTTKLGENIFSSYSKILKKILKIILTIIKFGCRNQDILKQLENIND